MPSAASIAVASISRTVARGMPAELAGGDRGHRCRLDVGDGELGGGMPFEQLARQPAVSRAEFEDLGVGHVGHLVERDVRELLGVAERTRRSTPAPGSRCASRPSSTSSRSRYSRRSVCSSRSRHDAFGPPRGMRSMSTIVARHVVHDGRRQPSGGERDLAEFVAAIDQGTTSTRCMIFDHDGAEVGRHQLEHEQILPKAGWVEHNPVEIWERTASVLTSALNKTKLSAGDLAALGITNQRETALVWNRKTGRPYYNAIVWQDTRTDRIASALDRDGRGDVIRRKAGLPPATYFSGGQGAVDPRERRRRARGRREGRRDLRHRRHLGAVEPDRRPARRRARHRRHQRQPDHADEPGDARLGRRTVVVLRHSAADAAGDQAVVVPGAVRHDPGRRAARRARCR